MINLSTLFEKFDIDFLENKIRVKNNLIEVLNFLKNNPEYDFDVLTSMVCIDLKEYIEIIYQVYSSSNNYILQISYLTNSFYAPSICEIYPSSEFDEREIFDLFGVKFDGNKNLKRILLPESWIGNPLLKSYKLNDERLSWNE